MHGWEGEGRKQGRHMFQDHGPGIEATSATNTTPNCSVFFLKDGRKIQVGDCALFQAGNAPPFIGFIRWLTKTKEDYLKLGVNWLYRPSDIKIAKGVAIEAAPNEVFYSFHRDEIPAASLLHPCKVAFLRKGVELPEGVPSFVCRRVYDVENKCLWWLTDQDYINERQEEVDHLLEKTRVEMHAAVQQGGRSPKQSNGSVPTQLKSCPDNIQGGSSSFSLQGKVKKREKNDQGTEAIKRERPMKLEDDDSGDASLESMIKTEISKITEKGGLSNVEAVEKLVNLMQLDRPDRKLDFATRVLLVDVIAATYGLEYLVRFMQLKGLSILDEWLQEVHRLKTGDGSSLKESEKSVNDFLLAMLRALDKLPVNLDALQTCNIGKSVNHLRAHKNLEVQKRSRSLVDTWKKRVEAEMTKNNDVKPVGPCPAVTWPVKSGFTEVQLAGTKRGSSGEVITKSGTVCPPSPCKTITARTVPSEVISKPPSTISGLPKVTSPLPASVGNTSKETFLKATGGRTSENLPLLVKEEKNSCSSSLTNSQSLSASFKEEIKNINSSPNFGKGSGGTSRLRRSGNNGFAGISQSDFQKETTGCKSGLLSRTSTLDRAVQSGLIGEKANDLQISDHVTPKLIVRLPILSHGGSLEERSSPSGSPDKFDSNDCGMKPRAVTDASKEPSQSDDLKDGQEGAEGNGRLHCVNAKELIDQNGKYVEESKAFCSIACEKKVPSDEPNTAMSSKTEFSDSPAAAADVGMNLLASVAAVVMSKTEITSSVSATHGCSVATVDNEEGARHLYHNGASRRSDECSSTETTNVDHANDLGSLVEASEKGMKNNDVLGDENKADNHCQKDSSLKSDMKLEGDDHGFSSSIQDTKSLSGEKIVQNDEQEDTENTGVPSVCKPNIEENVPLDLDADKTVGDEASSYPKCRVDGNEADKIESGDKTDKLLADTQSAPQSCSEELHVKTVDEVIYNSTIGKQENAFSSFHSDTIGRVSDSSVTSDHSKVEYVSCFMVRNASGPPHDKKNEEASYCPLVLDECSLLVPTEKATEDASEVKEPTACFIGPANNEEQHCPRIPELVQSMKAADANVSTSGVGDVNSSVKMDFDLNEGFLVDDGNQMGSSFPSFICSDVRLCNTSFPLPTWNFAPAQITVAAAAKGPFVPPENLLKSNWQTGWKGTAATSAFRPAEPRKILEIPLYTTDVPLEYSNNAKRKRPALDFDLNVTDEMVLEEAVAQSLAHKSGPEYNAHFYRKLTMGVFDLNSADESLDNGLFQTSESKLIPMRLVSGSLSNGEANSSRDFDLNGPGGEEPCEQGHPNEKTKITSALPQNSNFILNSSEFGSSPSLFSPSYSYSSVTIPSFLPDRGKDSYPFVPTAGSRRLSGVETGGGGFGGEVYRHPILPSSSAATFSHTTPPLSLFSYSGFPSTSNIQLGLNSFSVGPSSFVDSSSGGSCFPTMSSQLLGAGSSVSSQYPKPYVISLLENTSSSGPESSQRLQRRGLDLNTGPKSMEVAGRDGKLASVTPQLFANGATQAFVDDRARLYQISGGSLKRKEPEGGARDADRVSYKQSSWQ